VSWFPLLRFSELLRESFVMWHNQSSAVADTWRSSRLSRRVKRRWLIFRLWLYRIFPLVWLGSAAFDSRSCRYPKFKWLVFEGRTFKNKARRKQFLYNVPSYVKVLWRGQMLFSYCVMASVVIITFNKSYQDLCGYTSACYDFWINYGGCKTSVLFSTTSPTFFWCPWRIPVMYVSFPESL
jgi:hypothetical protein